MDPSLTALAELVAERLDGRTLATAESFTAGQLSQAFASVSGSMEWFAGGVVTYQTDAKHRVLDVVTGPVTEDAALAMANGAARLFGVPVALATTGVAGPDPQDGSPPGTVIIGWCIQGRPGVESFRFPDDDPTVVIDKGARAAMSQLAVALGTA